MISYDILLLCENVSKPYKNNRIWTKVLKPIRIELKKVQLIYGSMSDLELEKLWAEIWICVSKLSFDSTHKYRRKSDRAL